MDVPSKAKINSIRCILVLKDESVVADFEGRGSLEISYTAIRCMQYRPGMIIIDIQGKDRLVSYVITSKNAEKIRSMLSERVKTQSDMS